MATLPLAAPTDFGNRRFKSALVLVTNACNLRCRHCFVYREETPNQARDKMDDATVLYQLRVLRDRHGIRSMLFMGGEPMIRRKLVLKAMQLFEQSQIVTNGTYGIPSVPGHLVTVSLDGPRAANDALRGEGVFDKVKESVHARDPEDGTTVMLQMAITRHNAGSIRAFVETVADWPVDGIAFTFYVPRRDDHSGLGWNDLRQRDRIIDEIVELKKSYPQITANVGALQRMRSDVAITSTGRHGENCSLKEEMLPLYIGDQGCFERTFCCYGNDVDCSRCGAYAVFNSAYHRERRASGGPPCQS
jgi:MoaA/NifB/PqqE/SkfB family radical SAM enzyme